MAKSPMVIGGAAPAGGGAEEAPLPMDDASAGIPDEEPAPMDPEEEPGHEVLFTVCKEADGTYRLIMGDEEDAAAEGGKAVGEDDDAVGMTDEAPGKIYDSPGALLKAILDVLNEGMSSEGAEGSSEEQFQEGFGEDAAAPIAQKY